jgi:serine/threonine protein kinase
MGAGTMTTTAETRYTVERALGETPCGPVLLARDTVRQRQVAIFTLPAERQTADRAAYNTCLARFERGAEISRLVQHPNLVETYNCVVDADGGARSVAEYIAGPSLQQLLARGPLPLDQALGIARDISAALGALHAQGIVHRDVAPAFILLSQGDGAKLTGYGSAQIGRATQMYGLSADRPGTPGYISPEQEAGLGAVDERSDLYSLGAVLYEMLAGEPYARQQRNLALVRPDLPQPVVALVTKLLERQPAFRYQRAAEVTHDLAAILHPTPTTETVAQRPVTEAPAPENRAALPPPPLAPAVPQAPSAVTFAPPAPPPQPPAPQPPSVSPQPPYQQPPPPQPMPPWQGRSGPAPVSPVFGPPPGTRPVPYAPPAPRPARRSGGNWVLWVVIGVALFTLFRAGGGIFGASRRTPTATPVRATATRPAPTATRAAATGASSVVPQATRWQDPKGRMGFTLPPGWRVVGTGSQPDTVATLLGDGVFMLIRTESATQTIDAEFAALRASQSAAFGRTFTQQPVTPITIGGEAGKYMEWRAVSASTATTSATAPTDGVEWLVDHNGTRYSFLVSDLSTARPACDALIASVTFP